MTVQYFIMERFCFFAHIFSTIEFVHDIIITCIIYVVYFFLFRFVSTPPLNCQLCSSYLLTEICQYICSTRLRLFGANRNSHLFMSCLHANLGLCLYMLEKKMFNREPCACVLLIGKSSTSPLFNLYIFGGMTKKKNANQRNNKTA